MAARRGNGLGALGPEIREQGFEPPGRGVHAFHSLDASRTTASLSARRKPCLGRFRLCERHSGGPSDRSEYRLHCGRKCCCLIRQSLCAIMMMALSLRHVDLSVSTACTIGKESKTDPSTANMLMPIVWRTRKRHGGGRAPHQKLARMVVSEMDGHTSDTKFQALSIKKDPVETGS